MERFFSEDNFKVKLLGLVSAMDNRKMPILITILLINNTFVQKNQLRKKKYLIIVLIIKFDLKLLFAIKTFFYYLNNI
ncbi:hypothetical protein BpHYR1_030169 [Brachionus plicatilis]|uniref:Uncharacterized protein n=1 Tax=Brachionus plicatilis TaxID=10195 RepID=A0A3M7RGD5_BRAPC|nr:hypothetical protein BpHYR1_030169 [Brachionus plicatilis]